MITFNNIVERFEDFATSHFFIKSFSFGSPDDVDLAKFTEFPLMHLVYTGATYDSGTKTYNIEVYILDVPADKSDKVERQREVVSDAEQCAEDIIADIRMGGNIFTFAQDYEVVNATTTPLEEETKNVLSGVLLDLSVAIPYEWDACNAPIDGVTPGGGDEPSYARRGFLRMLTLDGSTDVLSVRTIKVNNGTLTDDGEGVVTLDTGGVDTLAALTDVTLANLENHDVLKYNSGQTRWENVDWLLILYTELKQGTTTTQNNGSRTDSALELTVTQAKLKAGITGVEITETSPGDIDLIVATDASGSTAYTAINIDGSKTANEADINLYGNVYIHDEGNGTKARMRLNSADNVNLSLPTSSGTLALTDDIPSAPVDSVNGQTGVVVLVTTDIDEGTNLYYTEARVAANAAVVANTAKVGITTQQAADITANNAKTGITPTQASEITANTAKVGITTQQADDITANNAKVGITQTQADDITANNAKTGITPTQAGEITANTAKVGVIAGGTSGQALVKASGTDYDLEWADAASGVQYHERFATDAETFRSGATDTVELYYTAKADGDGLAESASSDTPTAGKVIKRKIYYSEAAFADPDTGTWVEFTTLADDITFANAKAALLEYLKARTGGTVPISLKQTWEEVSDTAYLLDETFGSGAEAAYSTRQLRFAQTDCMVIRRASDSTTTTIGFDGSGNISEADIETFCTGTSCTVSEWKDQSGNGNDATAAAPSNEPTIYTGGALVKDGGRVAFTSTASTSFDFTQISNVNSVFSVLRPTDFTNSNSSFILGDSTNFDYHSGNSAEWLSATHADPVVRNGDNYLNGLSVNLTTLARSAGQYVLSMIHTDGTAVASRISKDRFLTRSWVGNRQELIIYSDDRTNDRTGIESNMGDYFTQNTPLLDTYSGAAAAYSLRLLDSTYTGDAIEVYNGSSYADIGFNVFGELDTVALAAHCGSNDGLVSKWYDQSSNSNTAAQTVTSKMPRIYDGSTGVVTENGKPAVEIDRSEYLSFNSRIYTARTMVAVLNMTAFQYNRVCGNSVEIESGIKGWSDGGGLDDVNEKFNINAVSVNGALDTTRPYGSDMIGLYNCSYFTGDGVDSDGLGEIGWHVNNRSLKGNLQELIVYPVEDTVNRTDIEDNINTFYDIY
jgi:hypothetical protein